MKTNSFIIVLFLSHESGKYIFWHTHWSKGLWCVQMNKLRWFMSELQIPLILQYFLSVLFCKITILKIWYVYQFYAVQTKPCEILNIWLIPCILGLITEWQLVVIFKQTGEVTWLQNTQGFRSTQQWNQTFTW